MTASQAEPRVKFSVIRCAMWAPPERDATAPPAPEGPLDVAAEPSLAQMPPMLRRHATRLARIACDVAYRALDAETGVPVVFCSRYGEVHRSVELLTALANDAELSPTSFGLSVHNAIVGLFAIARRDTANCSALAAGDDSAAAGVVEACCLLSDGADRVLLVVADSPLPTLFREFADVTPVEFAWAALLAPAGDNAVTLSWRNADLPPSDEARPPANLTAGHVLMGHPAELRHRNNGREWHWHREP